MAAAALVNIVSLLSVLNISCTFSQYNVIKEHVSANHFLYQQQEGMYKIYLSIWSGVILISWDHQLKEGKAEGMNCQFRRRY